ncbi:MAG: transporter permease [Labilithrix sp.]|nr:transporter permease [Labilithrix sp.]
MTIVLRMALRELWRVRVRLGLLALVLALQTMTIGGAYVMTHSFTASRDAYYEQLRFADLAVGIVPAADTELPPLDRLRTIRGVRGVSRRYTTRGTIEDQGEAAVPWPVVVVYLDPGQQEVNDLAVLEGRPLDPASPSGAIIDGSFAEVRGLHLGDPLVVNPHRFATRFTIAGIGMSPEYLAPAVDPRFLMPAKGSMGIVYAPRAKLDELFVDHLYNELLFTYQPGADEEATRRAIVAALKGLTIEEIVPRRSNIGYRLHEELLRSPRVLTPILALVVGLLGAIVAYVLVMRVVESQRREIGALLAVGFPPFQFVIAYLLVGLVPAVLGAGAGLWLAPVFGGSNAIAQARSMGVATPAIVVPQGTLAAVAAFAVLTTLVGVVVPLASILRMSPALAMRGGTEVSFRGLPRPLEALLGHARATTRYAIRNVVRRLRLSGAIVLLLGAGIAAPATLLTINSSWQLWSARTAARIQWDATVSFRVPLEPPSLVGLLSTPGLHATETFVQGRATLARAGNGPQEVRVRGVDVAGTLDGRDLTAGRDLTGDDALEIIVNESLVRDERPLAIGEKVRVASARGPSLELTVVGLVHDASASTVHVPKRTAQRLLELGDKVSGMFVVYGPMSERAAPPPLLPEAGPRPEGAEEIDFDSDAGAAAPPPPPAPTTPEAALLREEMVMGLQSRDAAMRTMQRMVLEQRSAIFPFLVVGMIFALAAVLSVLAVLVLERDTEYATLRAMGYGRAAIVRVVFTEIGLLGMFGLVAALLGWLALDAYLLHVLSRTLFPLPTAYRVGDVLTVAVPTLACLAIASALAVRQILRIDLRAVLCARGVG